MTARRRRSYSDDDKAAALAALAANGDNVNRTARQLGLSESTLRGWKNRRGTPDEIASLRDQKKGDLASSLEVIAHEIVGIIPGKLGEANLRELATALGIVIDKRQLLIGAPTDRTETTTATVQFFLPDNGRDDGDGDDD
jgi:transposase